MFISVFLACALLGTVVGFFAGLLGIGGGLIIVPVLVYLLPLLGISAELAFPMALATSLASIIFTSTSAAFAHHKNGNIPWPIAQRLVITVAIGAMLGAIIAGMLSLKALTLIFASAVLILAAYMFLSIKVERSVALPNNWVLQFIGLFTGVLASLMGIAGGAILVPILMYCSLSMRQAIGVATASGIIVALFGALGYVIIGLGQSDLPPWSIGYIYLPALLGIVLTSSLFAPLGVKAGTKLSLPYLKKGFAIFLMLVAIKMMWY
ncbi:sulfite exporter TauE/SafE family protein [Colwellia sp. MB3u-70]|uniref:sulfite exporter TauE/SafE family protein n=1 Tax=unclassified Colwellia TaxID=196834 RepID=UPI0015F3C630|nr:MULTISPECIES: sulfite exporter TauE/SafE family protein [unclassified Colwellia]MBA6291642.1 sulfite exporter TauE/SafE family protein [Colwellia sp. MB3u-8]MBA6309179.1 sulfite exporter TauE/SafE family protein [Colwellia sp. MB3u-70]